MNQQFDSSLLPTEAEHDAHYCSEDLKCCERCETMFEPDLSQWFCNTCVDEAKEKDDES